MPEVSTTIRSKPAYPACGDGIRQCFGYFRPRLARGHRAHVDVGVLDGVHADAVTQERTAGPRPRRVDGDDGHLQPVALIDWEATDQLVGPAMRVARPARPGDAELRARPGRLRRAQQLVALAWPALVPARRPVMKRASTRRVASS